MSVLETKAGEKMNKYDEIEKIANKILNKIKKMNLSKELLRSLDFKDLIENILFEVDTKNIVSGDYYYYFFDYITEKCTNLSINDTNCLWYCHKGGSYKELRKCIDDRQYFNNQIAEWFNKTVWDE